MSNNINNLKNKQRVLFSNKRKILKNKINLKENFFVQDLLSSTWLKESKVIASFLSIKSEISTSSLNKFIQNQKKILCLPVMPNNIKDNLVFKSYSEGEKLAIGKFNVKEPINDKIYLPDIIFTPCLCFDLNGFRLGYGGGYYDKTIAYLNSIKHNFYTVALAYDDQKTNKVVHDIFDQKLNYILTEKQLYKIL